MFVDPIPILRQALIDAGFDAGVSTPERFTATPFIRIGQVDGSILEEEYGDHTVLDLSVFARGYGTARRESLRVRQFVHELQATTYPKDDPGGFLFDRSQPVAGPIWIEHDNPEITEFLVTVDVVTRTTTDEITA